MFRFQGNCYIALPRHVAGERARISVSTAEPVTNGMATVLNPFWEGFDLSIAIARRGVAEYCTDEADFLSRRYRLLTENARGDLVRILPGGQIERVRMRIVEMRYLDFDAVVDDPGKEIYQGTSGAFLFVGDQPVGMAVKTPAPGRVRFIRIEEIALNLSRWLGSRSAAFADRSTAPESVEQPAGFSVRLEDAQILPTAPEHAAENVLSPEGAYIFRPEGRVARLIFAVETETPVTVSRVRMESTESMGAALPRRIVIEVDSAAPGREHWRMFWSGDMAPDGLLDTGARAPTVARRIRITISSAWTPGPVRLDRVIFE